MVFAVQCPNAKCKKYMLVEDHERGKAVTCLLCKAAIKVAGGPAPNPAPANPPPPPVRRRP